MSKMVKEMEVFFKELQKYAAIASDENVAAVLMVGGEALAADIRKLPKPRSNMKKMTHMLDTVVAERKGLSKVEVGWGAKGYYGIFVDRGTRKQRAQPHMKATWDRNKQRYYTLMTNRLFKETGGL